MNIKCPRCGSDGLHIARPRGGFFSVAGSVECAGCGLGRQFSYIGHEESPDDTINRLRRQCYGEMLQWEADNSIKKVVDLLNETLRRMV